MKQFRFATLSLTLAVATLFSSCSKDDPATNNNNSNTLEIGRSGIMFNSNTIFATSTNFNVRNTIFTSAESEIATDTRLITLIATEPTTGSNTRSAMITIGLPATANTTNGNLVADLSLPAGEDVEAEIQLFTTVGSVPDVSLTSTTGTLTITKLTANEIEGTFSGTVTDGGSGTAVLSDGSFAGRFP